jgi:hypothetical protein
MFQRKQTLFLFLGAIIALLTFLWPAVTYTVSGSEVVYRYMTNGVFANGVEVTDFSLKMPVWAFYALIATVLLVGAFLFKNRKRQMSVVRSVYILTLLTAFVVFSQHLSISAYLGKGKHLETSFGITMFLPLLIIVCVFMAMRGIKHDEDLVKSADRLR